MESFLIFTTALVTTLLLVPPVKQLAQVAGAVDEPNERKVHTRLIPRMGGLAMFFGVLVTYLVYLQDYQEFRGIFLGMAIIVIVGIVDDAIGLEPRLKLLGQVVAALAAILVSNIDINSLGGVLGSNFDLGILSLPLTLIWIVGITNAINLSDGLDGLASGISLIAFSSFGVLAYLRGDDPIVILSLVMVGAVLGFLKYNTHPAEIFMGDTGSLLLGYSLGTISLAGNFKSLTTMTLIAPILVLLVPICDTLWAIVRRLKEGRSPFSADKKHFHHELLKLGMNQSQTVSVIYAISGMLSIATVVLSNSSQMKFFLVPVLMLGVGLIFAHLFGLVDVKKLPLRWLVRLEEKLPFHQRSLMSRISLFLIYSGVATYVSAFAFGLPFVPSNMLIISTITMMVVLYLVITRGSNGTSFVIFSFFFLAALIITVTQKLLLDGLDWGPVSLAKVEPFAFAALVVGVFLKIIFKKRREIILSTPLEFFIFLVLITVPLVPSEIQLKYGLVGAVLRTFFLFLGLKIIALNSLQREQTALATSLASLVFIMFGLYV